MQALVGEVWSYVFSGLFFTGALVTLLLTLLSESIGVVLGLLLALAKVGKVRPIRYAVDAYIWIFRGTPVLLQLIFVYAALPTIGLRFTSFQSAVIALSLNESAYMAEIIRAGLLAVSPGQRTAAQALGMTELQVLRYIVLPQAVRVILPPTANQFIGMLKTSALASVVAVSELLLTAQEIATANFTYVPALVAAAIYYLLLTTLFSVGESALERRLDVVKRARARRGRHAAASLASAAGLGR